MSSHQERSDLELRLERINYLGDLRLEFLKRFSDEVSFAIERYAIGEVSVHIHAAAAHEKFCISLEGSSGLAEPPVLVWIADVSQEFRPVHSRVWLQSFDCCLVGAREVLNVSLMFDKLLSRVFDRKLCALLEGPGIQESEFINEIVQSGAEIVYDLTNQDTDDVRGYISSDRRTSGPNASGCHPV